VIPYLPDSGAAPRAALLEHSGKNVIFKTKGKLSF
jgi:hypothetical protein